MLTKFSFRIGTRCIPKLVTMLVPKTHQVMQHTRRQIGYKSMEKLTLKSTSEVDLASAAKIYQVLLHIFYFFVKQYAVQSKEKENGK